jgi:hypothetical protein
MLLIFVGSTFFAIAVNIINLRLLGGRVRSEWIVLVAVAIWFFLLLRDGEDRDAAAHLGWVLSSFAIGVLAGAVARYSYGSATPFPVSEFCKDITPVIASLLLGIVLVGTLDNAPLRNQKRLAMLYVVLGAIATAVGNVPTHPTVVGNVVTYPTSWIFGVCYLAVCGSLGASAFVVVSVARTWT